MTSTTMLSCLLETANQRAEEARVAAVAAAKRTKKEEKAAATAATDDVFTVLADATAHCKSTGGFPAVTTFMQGVTQSVAAFVTGGSQPSSTSSQSVDPAQAGVDQSVHDTVVSELATRTQERDNALVSARNLQTQVDGLTQERDEALNAPPTIQGIAQNEHDAVVAQRDRLQNRLTTLDSEVTGLHQRLDQANQLVDDVTARVEALPKIDTHSRTFGGGSVKLPLATAKKINAERLSLRQIVGLDPAPATVPDPAATSVLPVS